MLPCGWLTLGAALAFLVVAGDAFPWPANGELDVESFPVHPGVTQAITSPFHNFQTTEKQDDIHSDDDLQSANIAASNTRHKRNTKNDINAKAKVSSASEDYDDDDMYMEHPSAKDSSTASSENPDDVTGMGQHFFPSFAPLFPPAPPLGHSRPPLLFQEPAHSHRPPILRPQHNAFQPIGFGGPFREHKYIQAPAATQTAKSNSILGSGNFGVIRGGTFYNDNERGEINEYGSGESHNVYSPFYHNGHGRPAFYNGATNPRPQHHRGNDFFANFRDFADINTPAKSSYSEFYVVYVNRNGTKPSIEQSGTSGAPKPKNIIEQLKMIDQEKNLKTPEAAFLQAPDNKELEKLSKKGLSASKRKLALLQKEKHKQKNKLTGSTTPPKDLHEPLIALS